MRETLSRETPGQSAKPGNYSCRNEGKLIVARQDGTFGYICSIELLDIREIDVQNFEWMPPWPAGTEWMREKDRKRFHVPYSDAQLASIQQHALANARADAPQPKSSWFFYINLGLIGLIIAMAVYRFWPRSN